MTREVTLAATQFSCTWDVPANLDRPSGWSAKRPDEARRSSCCRSCSRRRTSPSRRTHGTSTWPGRRRATRSSARFSRLAAELEVVLPVSLFERAGQTFFNSVAIIDADGEFMGVYRKSHVPDATGYQEKYYFSPGDTGFKVWETAYARIGVGICWDQWFPEAARCMALQGAEVLLYPTAIGSDPPAPDADSKDAWQMAQRGHAVANAMPVVAANRIGVESAPGGEPSIRFYGSSFIAAHTGALLAEASRDLEEVVTATVDLDAVLCRRRDWSFFRDRRPELYGTLLTLDGEE